MSFQIFISYCTADSDLFGIKKIASKIEDAIENSKVWICQRTEDVGGDWVVYMETKIPESNLFLLFCTPRSNESTYVKDEWNYAYRKLKSEKIKILPIYYKKEFIPGLLGSVEGFQFDVFRKEDSIEKLIVYVVERIDLIKNMKNYSKLGAKIPFGENQRHFKSELERWLGDFIRKFRALLNNKYKNYREFFPFFNNFILSKLSGLF